MGRRQGSTQGGDAALLSGPLGTRTHAGAGQPETGTGWRPHGLLTLSTFGTGGRVPPETLTVNRSKAPRVPSPRLHPPCGASSGV